jgi:hypothetical protein
LQEVHFPNPLPLQKEHLNGPFLPVPLQGLHSNGPVPAPWQELQTAAVAFPAINAAHAAAKPPTTAFRRDGFFMRFTRKRNDCFKKKFLPATHSLHDVVDPKGSSDTTKEIKCKLSEAYPRGGWLMLECSV